MPIPTVRGQRVLVDFYYKRRVFHYVPDSNSVKLNELSPPAFSLRIELENVLFRVDFGFDLLAQTVLGFMSIEQFFDFHIGSLKDLPSHLICELIVASVEDTEESVVIWVVLNLAANSAFRLKAKRSLFRVY